MKLDKVKEAFSSVFEEDDALKYALATNIAKYGRPQSKPSDQPAKLTKGLEKKREKAVKDLKKTMDENKGRDMARDFISKMREAMRSLSDDEVDTFRKDIAQAFDMSLKEESLKERVVSDNESPSLKAKIAADDFMQQYRKAYRIVDGNHGREAGQEFKSIIKSKFAQLQEGLNEDKGTLNQIADILGDKFVNLCFDVNEPADRIDVRGSRSDLANFGDKLHGSKIYGYEVFYIEEDPGERGAIVRIVKSDSISRGGVNEATVDYDFSEKELIRVLRQLKRGASTEVDMIKAFSKALGREITDDELMREEMDPKEMKTGTYAGKKVVIHMHGSETEWKVEFIDTGKIVDYVEVMANLKFDDGTTYMDYLKEKKDKADRCLRIARRKMPQSSAYRSGLIVKCRKGMIWKKEK